MNTGSKAIAGSHVQPHTAANRQCFLIDYYAKELNLPCRARAFTFFFHDEGLDLNLFTKRMGGCSRREGSLASRKMGGRGGVEGSDSDLQM